MKMISPESDFKWEKTFPRFRLLLKPLTFQLSNVKLPSLDDAKDLLVAIKEQVSTNVKF